MGRQAAGLGIDFGTTTSRAWALSDDASQLVEVPSVVAIDPKGRALVSEEAEQYAARHPRRTIFGVKRMLGRKLYSDEITWFAGARPNEVVPSDNGDAWLQLGSRRCSPEELTACVLRDVASRVQTAAEARANRAVMTIPAMMDIAQRRALHDAASLAGLSVSRFVESGAAVVVAWDPPEEVDRVIAFDIGGGFLDVCVLHRAEGRWRVVSADGEATLGGDDLDKRVIDELLIEVGEDTARRLRQSPRAVHRLRLHARDLRHALSTSAPPPTELRHVALADETTTDVAHRPFTKTRMRQLWMDELEVVDELCKRVRTDLETPEAYRVIVFGEAANTPPMMERIRGVFANAEAHDGRGLAAHGAARIAASEERVVRSVMPLTVALKVSEGRMRAAVPRNCPLPCHRERRFAPASARQTSIVFEIYQGEAECAHDNLYVARLVTRGLTAEMAHTIHFAMDDFGRLDMRVEDDRHTSVDAEIRFSTGLSSAHLEALRSDAPPITTLSDALAAHDDEVDDDGVLMPTSNPPDSSEPSWVHRASSIPPPSTPRMRRPTRIPPAPTSPGVTLASEGVIPQSRASASGVDLLAADALIGTTLADRYEITDVIGEGGMGRVYLAKHRMLARDYAVKVIHPELAANATLSARFLREARSAAKIKSDYVVSIFDFGELDSGSSYFVMELLEGESLEDVLDDGPLSLERTLRFAQQIASGLAAAHKLEIVHRDLKPENVMLVGRASDQLVKLLDFGIAKAPTSAGGPLTLTTTLIGTPHYMAPEQVKGPVDARADIYSLGILMYEMVTGDVPFDDDSLAILFTKHQHTKPDPPRALVGPTRCPRALENLILSCLEKDKEARVQTAGEVADMLQSIQRSVA